MQFRILGPLDAESNGRSVHLGGLRQRRVLAALLLRPNQTVGIAHLIKAAWDDAPPATVERQVRNRIAVLRSILTRLGVFIDTEPSGYRLRVRRDELDSLVFEDLVARGQATGNAGLLRQALGLWRGPVLAGLGGELLAHETAGWAEQKLAAQEACLELELAAGRHQEIVEELGALVDQHPLRERLVGQLMTALHRCDQREAAIAAYQELATRLADELGIDPSPELRARRAELVAAEPPAVVRLRPAQLPADVYGFAGRSADLAHLDRLLSDEQPGGRVSVLVIAGTAGAGKTALAVHWAHRIRDRFPDGQLFVNLRGFSATAPVRPIDALAGFLRGLGVPAERVPTDLPAATALYHRLLADRRVLVVLDNAADAEQVRPLLSGDAGCLTVVTSRNTLTGLGAGDGVSRITLGVMPPGEAETLLRRVLGPNRVVAEPTATAELAALCAYLPLALRITAARVADGEELATHVKRLRTADRLASLAIDGDDQAAVRIAFDRSYAGLPAPAQRLFRLLGLVPGPDFTAEVASALIDCDLAAARGLMRRLAAAHLLEQYAPGRYAFHDLLRLYATALASSVGAEPDRTAATDRLYGFYAHTARAAVDVLTPGMYRLPLPEWTGQRWTPPGFDAAEQALTWLDTELPDLVAAIRHAAEHGPRPMAWLLTDALRGYFYQRVSPIDMLSVVEAALSAAVAEGELPAQAMAHRTLAVLYLEQDRIPEVVDHASSAVEAARAIKDPAMEAQALTSLSIANRRDGRPGIAVEYLARALELYQHVDDISGQADSTGSLAVLRWELGELAPALDAALAALAVAQRLGSLRAVVALLNIAAEINRHLGRLDDAGAGASEAAERARRLGAVDGEAESLGILSMLDSQRGRYSEGFEVATAALAMAREARAYWIELNILNAAATACDGLARYDAAIERRLAALALARRGGYRYQQTVTQVGLAGSYCYRGEYQTAATWVNQAFESAAGAGYRVLEGQARTVRAEIRLGTGSISSAVDEANIALAIHRATGYRPGEARTLRLLADAGTDRAAANEYARRAAEIHAAMGIVDSR